MSTQRNAATDLERAVRFAQLEAAIDEAQALAISLGSAELGGNPEARLLYARLESLRAELGAIRGGTWAPDPLEIPALWRKFSELG